MITPRLQQRLRLAEYLHSGSFFDPFSKRVVSVRYFCDPFAFYFPFFFFFFFLATSFLVDFFFLLPIQLFGIRPIVACSFPIKKTNKLKFDFSLLMYRSH